jgi:hypothetical protein
MMMVDLGLGRKKQNLVIHKAEVIFKFYSPAVTVSVTSVDYNGLINKKGGQL